MSENSTKPTAIFSLSRPCNLSHGRLISIWQGRHGRQCFSLRAPRLRNQVCRCIAKTWPRNQTNGRLIDPTYGRVILGAPPRSGIFQPKETLNTHAIHHHLTHHSLLCSPPHPKLLSPQKPLLNSIFSSLQHSKKS